MDKNTKKLKMLKELDSKTDWEAVIREQNMLKTAATSKAKDATGKLTKSQKKRLKLEKQQQEVQESLKAKNVETIVYNNPDAISTKLSKQTSSNEQTDVSTDVIASTPAGIDIDMRQTRFEIMKFGINSLKAKDLEDAETSLAINLGARPNKRPSINYKELQVQRKKERELEKEEATTLIKPNLKMNMKKKSQGDAARKGGKGDKGKKPMGGRPTGRTSKLPRNRARK